MEKAADNRRTLEQINKEYETVVTFIGDIEAKLAILTKKKEVLLRRVYELDLEAMEVNSSGAEAK